MAHFAEIDDAGEVLRVLVVANEDILDEQGRESESVGIAFLQALVGEDTQWVQCSYNSNFRGHYPGPGDTWDPELGVFIEIDCMYPSWSINPLTGYFEPPVARPDPASLADDVVRVDWDEQAQDWHLTREADLAPKAPQP